MNDSELNALFKLLADTDDFISESARKKLFDEYKNIEDKISYAVLNSEDEYFKEKATEIIEDYNFKKVQIELQKWKQSKNVDLLKGLYLLANFFYNELNFQTIFDYLDKLKRSTSIDFENLTPIEQIRLLNFILFKNNRFKVNFDESIVDIHLINRVFETKKAAPFMMTVVYYLFAKKVGIPLYLVLNKNVVLLGYHKNTNSDNLSIPRQIHFEFFVNPADRGFILTHEDIKRSLTNLKNKLNKNFSIITASHAISIILDKLIFSHKKQVKIKEFLIKLKEQIFNHTL